MRQLHTGWAQHNDLPDTFLVYAECDDEATTLVMIRPTPGLRALYLVTPDAVATSPAYRLLVDEHRGRCRSCLAWETAA